MPRKKRLPPKSAKAHAQDALVREKQARALNLRKAGASLDQIAKELGYADRSGAKKAIDSALLAIIGAPVAEYVAVEVEKIDLEEQRLDAVLFGVWSRATPKMVTDAQGLPTTQPPTIIPADLDAIDRVVRLSTTRHKYMERRARLLGLDAKVEVKLEGDASTLGLAGLYAMLDQQGKLDKPKG